MRLCRPANMKIRVQLIALFQELDSQDGLWMTAFVRPWFGEVAWQAKKKNIAAGRWEEAAKRLHKSLEPPCEVKNILRSFICRFANYHLKNLILRLIGLIRRKKRQLLESLCSEWKCKQNCFHPLTTQTMIYFSSLIYLYIRLATCMMIIGLSNEHC